ncbi:MAG: co-chaperone GroES [Bacteroidales bacterium]|nr:co-chaperone GroES [Bacteroidales bacterium]
MKELAPVNQNVVLDITNSGTQKTASGIIIPDTAKEKPKFARIVAMSAIENAETRPGDLVIFKQYGGTEIEFEEKLYLYFPMLIFLPK